MAISGRLAAAARAGLQEIQAANAQRDALARQQTQQQFLNDLRLREITNAEAAQQQGIEERDRARRDQANLQGLQLMNLDEQRLARENAAKADAALAEQVANDPNLPESVRTLARIGGASALRKLDPKALRSISEIQAEDEHDINRAGRIADAQARAGARYREPKSERYEKIETVDDSGNPVVTYLTPEEVRQQGGVRSVPKTTAKAQGPATVNAILGQISDLSQRINTGGRGPASTATGIGRSIAGSVNLDNDVAEYEALIQGFTPMIARAVGHTGVLTQQDVDSVRALFPRPSDNQTLAQNKLNRVRSLLAGMQPSNQGAVRPAGSDARSIREMAASHGTDAGSGAQRKPIPGVPGGIAEFRNGKWVRVQ